MAALGAGLLMETLPAYLSGDLRPRPQPEEGVTYAPMLKKEDGRLDFERPAVQLERKVRAFHPWPGSFFDWNGEPLKVLRARLGAEKSPGAGNRFIVEGLPAVGTGDGILILDEVQPAGKKAMSGKAFLAGGRDWN
jgi:methionyl-tRNA formyltransferase